jgi:FMN phosphatase YigB (HAD superfamily)
VRLKTVLFDLDGTLVAMRPRRIELMFALRAFWRFRGVVRPWRLGSLMREAIIAMRSHRSERTNFRVFIETLAARTGRPFEDLESRVRTLTDRDFGRLAASFYPIPGARETVVKAHELGFRIVLATDPVFPLSAVKLRMGWGSVLDLPWDHVTTSETMTRCKPDPDYYLEVVRRVGCRPEECLMIGNDARMDLPAREAGLLTYLVDHPWSEGVDEAFALGLAPHLSGTFADLRRFLETAGGPPAGA